MSQSGFFPKDKHEDADTCASHEEDVAGFDPPDAPGKSRIEKLRAIVDARAVMCVEGQPVDLYSASVVTAVYDSLSKPENRHTLMSPISILRVIDLAMRTLARHEEKTRAA